MTREFAIVLLQVLTDVGVIENAAEPEKKDFVDGYFFHVISSYKESSVKTKFTEVQG
jgi:hypothetical protein